MADIRQWLKGMERVMEVIDSPAERPRPANITHPKGVSFEEVLTEGGDPRLASTGRVLEVDVPQIKSLPEEIQDLLFGVVEAAEIEGRPGRHSIPSTFGASEFVEDLPQYKSTDPRFQAGPLDPRSDLFEGIGLGSEGGGGSIAGAPMAEFSHTYAGHLDQAGRPLDFYKAFRDEVEELAQIAPGSKAWKALPERERRVAERILKVGTDNYISETVATTNYAQINQLIRQNMQGLDVDKTFTREMGLINDRLRQERFVTIKNEIDKFNKHVQRGSGGFEKVKQVRAIGPVGTPTMQTGRDLQMFVSKYPQWMKENFPNLVDLVSTVNRSRMMRDQGGSLAEKTRFGIEKENLLLAQERQFGGRGDVDRTNYLIDRPLHASERGGSPPPGELAFDSPVRQELGELTPEDVPPQYRAALDAAEDTQSMDDIIREVQRELSGGDPSLTQGMETLESLAPGSFVPERSNTGRPILPELSSTTEEIDLGLEYSPLSYDTPFVRRMADRMREYKIPEHVRGPGRYRTSQADQLAAGTSAMWRQREAAGEAEAATAGELSLLEGLLGSGKGIPRRIAGQRYTGKQMNELQEAIRKQRDAAIGKEEVGDVVSERGLGPFEKDVPPETTRIAEGLGKVLKTTKAKTPTPAQVAFKNMSRENQIRTILKELQKVENSNLSPADKASRRLKIVDRALAAIEVRGYKQFAKKKVRDSFTYAQKRNILRDYIEKHRRGKLPKELDEAGKELAPITRPRREKALPPLEAPIPGKAVKKTSQKKPKQHSGFISVNLKGK